MLLLGVMFSGNPRPILLVLLRHIVTVFFSLDGGRRFKYSPQLNKNYLILILC